MSENPTVRLLRLTTAQEYSEDILREVFGMTPEQIEANTIPGLYGLRLRHEEEERIASDARLRRDADSR